MFREISTNFISITVSSSTTIPKEHFHRIFFPFRSLSHVPLRMSSWIFAQRNKAKSREIRAFLKERICLKRPPQIKVKPTSFRRRAAGGLKSSSSSNKFHIFGILFGLASRCSFCSRPYRSSTLLYTFLVRGMRVVCWNGSCVSTGSRKIHFFASNLVQRPTVCVSFPIWKK